MGTGGYIGGLDVDWSTTEFSCVTCGEAIMFAEENHVVTIVMAQLFERGMQFSPLIFEDGDFLWEPQFFCSSCWEAAKEEIDDLVRDVPMVEDHYSITDCSSCHSGIRAGEVVGLITSGEVHHAKRSPNGEPGGSTFECTTPDPHVLCIGCINKLSSEIVDELWNEPVRQFHECPEGTEIRCWRNGCPAEEDNDCANCYTQTG